MVKIDMVAQRSKVPRREEMKENKGLFLGKATIDNVYLLKDMPKPNEKLRSIKSWTTIGGCAYNACLTARLLGGSVCLSTPFGDDIFRDLICRTCVSDGVDINDVATYIYGTPISSILVVEKTGERCVINSQPEELSEKSHELNLKEYKYALWDGQYPSLFKAKLKDIYSNNIPIILDGGGWRCGIEELFPFFYGVILSKYFKWDDKLGTYETVDKIFSKGVRHIVITNEEGPVQYFVDGKEFFINPPSVPVLNTLGAGDVFHGAFCFFHFVKRCDWFQALEFSTSVASFKVRFHGIRQPVLIWRKSYLESSFD
ncbi:MAG: hypothetical protein GVY13_10285 [Alphaproteobacteria bacterium]|jgi:sugar/nucleoside kinase (ribokinase family)|nr:hypothetical protein [Alphaproteobacteria bacterium]